MDRRRLQPRLRRTPARSGEPVGPARTQGHAPRRPGPVRAFERPRGSRHELGAADRGAVLHGSRRSDGVPVHALADLQRLHRAQRASAGDRPVGRHGGRGDRARADRRGMAARDASRGPASSSPSHRSRRSGRRLVARYVPRSRDPDVRPIDRPGFALSTSAMGLIVYTIIEAPDVRLGQPPQHRRLRAGPRPAGRVHRLGAPHERPDARRRAVQEPALHGRVRRGDGLVLHAARVHLPDDPVLPVHQALRPALGGRPPASRRRVRGRVLGARDEARGQVRHQDRGRLRPGDGHRLLRVGRRDRGTRQRLLDDRDPDGPLRHRAWA